MMQRRQVLGNILYIASILITGLYAINIVTLNWLSSKNNILLFVGIISITIACSSLLTEDVGIRGFGTAKKSERPDLYWFQIIFLFLLGGVLLALDLLTGVKAP